MHHHELLEPLVEHAHLLLFEAPENLLHGVGLARSNLRAQPVNAERSLVVSNPHYTSFWFS